MNSAYGYLSLFGIGAVLTILWVFALVWIWQDADDTYGYGWFWAALMFLFPFVTLIVYLILKRFTHRTVNEDLQAWENRESRHGWGWRSQSENHTEDLSQPLSGGGKFKPYQSGFNDSIEEYLRKQPSEAVSDDDWLRKD